MAVEIKSVLSGSPAAKAGLQAGDILLALNGKEIIDVLDYRFYMLEPRLQVTYKRGGTAFDTLLEKEEYDETGIEFETYLMDSQRGCRNQCIFCFIDQLPKGMRESLYFKDDDSRLSFLFGNYITLTNLSRHEIDRIKEMHISPVNISVHTTNPELRVQMMKNKNAGKVLGVLHEFANAGIAMNCQLVLCPGVNDGEELKRSLADLGALYPAVQSVAAVPVGITKYREGLYPLVPYTPEQAGQVIDIMEAFGDGFLAEHGTRLCYPADEFYLKAGRKLPDGEFYEEYAQIENGVGMWTSFLEDFTFALEEEPGDDISRELSLVTGVAAKPLLEQAVALAKEKFPYLTCYVYGVKNEFFGEHITVAGLITGGDILKGLENQPLGEKVLLPACVLRSEGDLFLDDLSLEAFQNKLPVPVEITHGTGENFLKTLLRK